MRYIAILLFIAMICAVYPLQKRIDKSVDTDPDFEMAYLPNGKLLKFSTMGFDGIYSDCLWIKSFQYFMKHFNSDRDWKYLVRIYDIITDLDPRFEQAYIYGSYFMTGAAGKANLDGAVRLLTKGTENNPDTYRLFYELGIVYDAYLKDKEKAAEFLARAGEREDCPPYVRQHAESIYREHDRFDKALIMWERIREKAKGEDMKKFADWKVKQILSEKRASLLTEAVQRYRKKYNAFPKALQDLVDGKIIDRLPSEPYGETFILDPITNQVFSPEHLRTIFLKRMGYLRRIVEEYYEKQGKYPTSLSELIGFEGSKQELSEKLFLHLGLIPVYDPKTGKMHLPEKLRRKEAAPKLP